MELTPEEREQWDRDPDEWPCTPPLNVFRVLMDESPELWWRAGSGHALNAYQDAIALLDKFAVERRAAKDEGAVDHG